MALTRRRPQMAVPLLTTKIVKKRTKHFKRAHSDRYIGLKGGGLDKLTLDSLYGDGAYRQMQKQKQLPYGSAPHNPFMMAAQHLLHH
ncbi:uncharacterized protein [Lolium perenne]|uniref:uncharacterized protein isoform X3 n=1 Tax=Lolium perenne TaxID=4522 RepID=UPI003A9A40B6